MRARRAGAGRAPRKRLKLPVDAVSVAAQTSLEAVFEYWDDYKPDVLL